MSLAAIPMQKIDISYTRMFSKTYTHNFLFVILLFSCNSSQKNPEGKWVNVSLNLDQSIGTIQFNKDNAIVTATSGKITQFSYLEGISTMFQTDFEGELANWEYLTPKDDKLFLIKKQRDRVDTIHFIPYGSIDHQTLSYSDMKSVLIDHYWMNADGTTKFQFLQDSTIVQSTYTDQKISYYRYEWELLYFDSLSFLKTFSPTPSIPQIRVKSDSQLELWYPDPDTIVELNSTTIDEKYRERVTEFITGTWRIVESKNYLTHPSYKSMQFDVVLSSFKSFHTINYFGEGVSSGEWNFDNSGGYLLLDFNHKNISEGVQFIPSNSTAKFCFDGECFEYKKSLE